MARLNKNFNLTFPKQI